jgi:regulatory protein
MSEELERCYVAAMRILAYRFNSTAELRRKLISKRFEADVIDATLTRLADEKWLDDERFAGALVRTRSGRRVGKMRILRELNAAGVERDAARAAVAENIDPEREQEQLKALCLKRMRALGRRHGTEWLDTAEGRNKLTVWLLNQGYDAALVQSVIRETRLVHHQPDS